jgi:hypothetical protein
MVAIQHLPYLNEENRVGINLRELSSQPYTSFMQDTKDMQPQQQPPPHLFQIAHTL